MENSTTKSATAGRNTHRLLVKELGKKKSIAKPFSSGNRQKYINSLLQELEVAGHELAAYDQKIVELKKELKEYRDELEILHNQHGDNKTRLLLDKYKKK